MMQASPGSNRDYLIGVAGVFAALTGSAKWFEGRNPRFWMGRLRAGKILAATAFLFVGLFFSGCTAFFTTPLVRVVASPPPVVSSTDPLPSLPEGDARLPLILSEDGRFTHPNVLKFFAAREAFWDYDTDAAVRLLRELRQDDGMSAEHFHDLVLHCYEQSGRWAEMPALYAEFGLEDSRPGRLKHARFMASLPPRQIAFAPGALPGPMELRWDDWVTAEGEINGRKARLTLDTGAGWSVISEGFARRAGVEIFSQTISLSDANGSARDTPIGLIRELRLGGLTVRNLPVVVSDAFAISVFGEDAIVGWDILQQADVTWDFPAKLMTLAAPSGPISSAPNLAGRIAPILSVLSSAGRPIEFLLDTGAHGNRRNSLWLVKNEGVLATKLRLAEFRQSWLPTISGGLHSLSASWPRRARPFSFWMDGYRFDVPSAVLQERVDLREQLVYADGVVGNTPFLSGKLRICGVRRLAVFEPGRTPQLSGATSDRTDTEIANASSADLAHRRRIPFRPEEPLALLDLATVATDRAFLSDAAWSDAKVGWGQPARNQYWVSDQFAVFLMLQGQVFDKGIYAHSPSRYVFALDGKWKTFAATVGLRDGAHQQGSAVFTVCGDGRELYASRILRVGSRCDIKVDVSGVTQLELVAEGGEGHPHNSWAIWIEPRVER